MYDAYFAFGQPPFASVPKVDLYVPTAAIEAARAALSRCIERGEGAGVVVGGSGTGKTLLCQLLAEQFRAACHTVLLCGGRLSTRRALLQAILYELGQPYRGMDEGELRLALVDFLTVGDATVRGMLLLVDEAHTLPLRLLEEIRMLTNLAHDGRPLVKLVLAGGCVLEERFASPKLDAFNQRLAARCYLQSLERTETQQYIHGRIAAVGGSAAQLFPEETCAAVQRATDGVPRLINQVCDHALLLAYANGCKQLEPAQIEEAWGDLQQLPTRCSEASSGENSGGSVVEFGNLDDLPAADNQHLATASAAAQAAAASEVSMASLRITPEGDKDDASLPQAEERLDRIEHMLSSAEEDFRPAGSIGPEVELIFDEAVHPFQERFQEEEVVTDRYAAVADASRGESDSPRPPAPGASGPQGPQTVPLCRANEFAAVESDDADMLIIEEAYDDRPAPDACSIVPVRRLEYGQLFARMRRS